MKSCIYEGQVRHRRFTPREHHFNYSLFLMYLDLDEADTVFKRFWFWSTTGFNLAWFKRGDHMGKVDQSLSDVVRNKVELATGQRPLGPVRLLTHFRYLGFGFNPVSFYYCFNQAGDTLETVVCEVNNTPWGEQHLYVLDESDNVGDKHIKKYQRSKEFHVSPFMPMDIEYNWRFKLPAQSLSVHMENLRLDKKIFDATLNLKKVEINSYQLTRILIQYPMLTLKVVLGIYYEAFRLWIKKTPIFDHPQNIKEASEQVTKQ